jgi:hypothetical protein
MAPYIYMERIHIINLYKTAKLKKLMKLWKNRCIR